MIWLSLKCFDNVAWSALEKEVLSLPRSCDVNCSELDRLNAWRSRCQVIGGNAACWDSSSISSQVFNSPSFPPISAWVLLKWLLGLLWAFCQARLMLNRYVLIGCSSSAQAQLRVIVEDIDRRCQAQTSVYRSSGPWGWGDDCGDNFLPDWEALVLACFGRSWWFHQDFESCSSRQYAMWNWSYWSVLGPGLILQGTPRWVLIMHWLPMHRPL